MSDLWFWIIAFILGIPIAIWDGIKGIAKKVYSLFR
jgi:hypothetical protein